MERTPGGSPPKRHSKALPRRPTRGPLDISESPISIPTTAQPKLPAQVSNMSSASFSTAPRTLSPQPSTLTFRTAQSTLSSPSRSTFSKSKDFSSLLRPEIYHPLTLLDVPPPFRVAASQADPTSSLDSLINHGYFRNAAIKAAQILTTSPSLSHTEIFALFYTRLACLTLCNATTLASQEVKALEDLSSAYYHDEETGVHLCPWELRVLAVRLQGIGFNDPRRGVMGYYDLVREARLNLTALKKSRKTADEEEKETVEEEIELWESRLSELGIRVASALIEMEDLEGATRFLKSLDPSSFPGLEVQTALLWLCIGDVEAARSCIAGKDENEGKKERQVIIALAHIADNDFDSAASTWEELISSPPPNPDLALYKQNLGVCLLYLGRMDEARTILSDLIEGDNTTSHNSFHALTFNLSTIYELCTERSRALKIGLAEKVAGLLEEERERGPEGEKFGWEKVNGDFKL